MREIYEKWWDRDTKVFMITNYKRVWRENGNKPRLCFFTNGAKRRNGDKCLDVTLIIGYTIFNYTNFALQERRC